MREKKDLESKKPLYYIRVKIIKPSFKDRINSSKKRENASLVYLYDWTSIIFSLMFMGLGLIIIYHLRMDISLLKLCLILGILPYWIYLDVDLEFLEECICFEDSWITLSEIRHELIHSRIFTRLTHLKQRCIALIDDRLQCLQYYPSEYHLSKHIPRFLITEFMHLIHDCLMCIFEMPIDTIFIYLKYFIIENYNHFKMFMKGV